MRLRLALVVVGLIGVAVTVVLSPLPWLAPAVVGAPLLAVGLFWDEEGQ